MKSIIRLLTTPTPKLFVAAVFAISVVTGPFLLTGTVAAACNPLDADHGFVTTTVNIPETKTYRVWSRMKVPDGTYDTYFLEIDGDQCIWVGGPQEPNRWNWIDFKDHNPDSKINVELSKGQHTLRFIGNDEGVKLDRVIFVSDHNCTPTSQTGTECDIPEDKTAPSVQLTAPPAGSKIGGERQVAANASDNIAVARVEFYVNSVRRHIDTDAPYEFILNTTELQDGDHLLIAKAFDTSGNVGSDSYKVTIDNSGVQPPPPPKNIQTKPDPSGHSITISWEPSPGASGYQIFRDGVPIAQVGPDATSYTDNDVIPNTDYDYQVTALNEFGLESDPSDKVNTKTNAVNDTDAPSEVREVAIEPINSGQINLQWEASVDNVAVKFYDIYRSTNGEEAQKIAQITSTSFGDVGLEPDTEYQYFVRARDTNDNMGAPSETVTARTPAAEKKGVIYGAVKDQATAKAIQGATVVVTARDGKKYIYTTSRQGEYLIRRLETGDYNATYRAEGFKSVTRSFVSNNDVIRRDASIEKR
jgi:fibronectin type 3 domain-containing protein